MAKSILFRKQPATQHLTPEQQKDLKFAEDFYEEGMKRRRPYERQWYINMAYFLDHQWLTWDETKRTLEKPLIPTWRVHSTVNKIKPNVLHMVAKLTKNKPQYKAIPASTEDADQNRAEISRKVLLYLHRINQMDILNQRLWLWKVIYGTAFKEPYFDETKGTKIPKKVKEDEQGIPIKVKGKEQYYATDYTGEVGCEILSPFSIIPETGATSLESSMRVMRVVTRPVEYIRERYKNGKFVQAEMREAGSSMENQLQRLMGEQFGRSERVTQPKEKEKSSEGFAVIKELREKPSKEYPEGRLIRVANKVLLDSTSLPYEFMIRRRTLGLVKYDYIEVGDRFWGDTPITSAIPIQTEYNKTLSQITEIKNLMGKPKWIAYKQNKLIQTAITSEPGEVIEVTHMPGVPDPHPVVPPPIPAYISNLLEIGDRNMEDVTFVKEVAKGATPPGVQSGVAIQYLQEQVKTVFGPVSTRFEAKEAEAGTYELEIVKEKYKETRLLKIVGDNNEIEVIDFEATEDMPTDVIVESGSALPESLTAKQQLIHQYFTAGMLGDPQDPQVRQKSLRLAEMGGIDVIYEEAAADEREAEREHKLWEKIQEPPVQVFDNHKTHIIKHHLFCKSDRYRNIVASKPRMENIISMHIMGHMEMDPERQAMQEQKQMMKEQMDFSKRLQGIESQLKIQKSEDDRAKTTSQIMTDVSERETGKPMGGT